MPLDGRGHGRGHRDRVDSRPPRPFAAGASPSSLGIWRTWTFAAFSIGTENRLTTPCPARYYLDTSSPPARALDLFNAPRSGYFFASAENGEKSVDKRSDDALLFRYFLPVRLGFGLVQGSLGGVLFCG